VLDAPLGTVRGRLRRGRQRLVDVLEPLPSSAEARGRVVTELDGLGGRAAGNPERTRQLSARVTDLHGKLGGFTGRSWPVDAHDER